MSTRLFLNSATMTRATSDYGRVYANILTTRYILPLPRTQLPYDSCIKPSYVCIHVWIFTYLVQLKDPSGSLIIIAIAKKNNEANNEINVLVAGMPNVGKSSLLNSLRGAGTSGSGKLYSKELLHLFICLPLAKSPSAPF